MSKKKRNSKTSIIAFLCLLRNLHPDLERKCLYGSCFKLYLLLREVWTDAEAWCNVDHVITKIGDAFYDIRGEVLSDGFFRMKDEPTMFNRAYHWGTPLDDTIKLKEFKKHSENESKKN